MGESCISCRRRSHANCCIKVKNLQLQHQLHQHTHTQLRHTHTGHTHAHITALQHSSSRQWQRHLSVHTHTRTHTRTHGYHGDSHACHASHCHSSLPLLLATLLLSSIMPKCSYLRNERRIASHCIASHVLFLSFDLRLPADWLVMDMDMPLSVLNFILQLHWPHLLPAPSHPSGPYPHTLESNVTLSELNNFSAGFVPCAKMATCNYVLTNTSSRKICV